MSEANEGANSFENSIVANERENAPQQNRAKAVHNVRRLPGMEQTTSEDLDYIEREFPALREMQSATDSYQTSLVRLSEDAYLDLQERNDRYTEALETARKDHEAAARKFEEAVEAERQSITKSLFGIGQAKDAAAYRTAVLQYKDAEPSEVSEAMELAEFTGDKDLERALAAVADRRGLDDIVHPHLARRGSAYMESYTKRGMLPTPQAVGILSGSFKPREAFQGEILPTSKALKDKADAERRESIARAHNFRR